MPIDAIRRTQEMLSSPASLGAGCDMDLTGALFLQPTNKVFDQWMQSIQSDGAPAGMDIEPGSSEDGFKVYCSRVNEGPETMQNQNLALVDATQDTYQIGNAIVHGGAPVTDLDVAANVTYPLEPCTVNLVASANAGFAAGLYYAALSVVDKNGKHSDLSEPVVMEVAAGSGQLITITLPFSIPEGGVSWGIWLSEVNKGPETLRLQVVVRHTGQRTYVLKGPYVMGRLFTPSGGGGVGQPNAPVFGKDNGDFWLESDSPHDLQAHTYEIVISEVVDDKEGKASASSSPLTISTVMPRTAIAINPRHPHKKSTGFRVYVILDSGKSYELVKKDAKEKGSAFGLKHTAMLWGYKQHDSDIPGKISHILVPAKIPTGDKTGGRDEKKRDADKKKDDSSKKKRTGGHHKSDKKDDSKKKLSAKEERKQKKKKKKTGDKEDETEIEAPSMDTPPLATGPTIPAPGDYYVSYSRVVSGEETLVAPPVKKTVTAANVMEVVFPDITNRIRNAMFKERNATGAPSGWTLDTTNSSFSLGIGVLQMQTTGAIGNTNTTPSATSTLMPIVPGRVETLRGTVAITAFSAGQVTVRLQQLNDALTVLTDTVITTLTASSRKDFVKRFGPIASGGEVAWNDGATQIRLVVRAENLNRNLTFQVYNLALHPYDGEPRRFTYPGDRLPAVSTTDPSVPYDLSTVVAVSAPSLTPLSEITTSTTGTTTTAPGVIDSVLMDAGTLPAGWSIVRTVVSANTEAIITSVAALEGAQGFRARDDETAQITENYITKTYTAPTINTNTLAVRALIKLVRPPTGGSTHYERLLMIATSGGTPMAFISQAGNGNVLGSAISSGGNQSNATIATGLSANTLIDVEIILTGGLSSSTGSAKFYLGINGAPRTLVSTISKGWQTSSPAMIKAGGITSPSSFGADAYTYHVDSLYVTDVGWSGTTSQTPSNAQPLLNPLPEPDRPTKTGTVLFSGSAATDQTITASNRTQLGVRARFAVGGTLPAVDRTLLQIKNSAGTVTLADAILKATTGAVQVRSGTNVTQVGTAAINSAFYVEAVVQNAGSATAGIVTGWYHPSTGVRTPYAFFNNLDLSAGFAQRGIVLAGAEYTISEVTMTEAGFTEYRDRAPDGSIINQAYTQISLDETQGDAGITIEEGFLRPGVAHTFAVYIAHQGVPVAEGHQPLVLQCMNEEGEVQEIGSVYGTSGVTTVNSAWTDRSLVFTPSAGYYRWRAIHKSLYGGGIYRWQEPLMAEGTLNTQALRDAARVKAYATRGMATAYLRGKIPNVLHNHAFGETWRSLGVVALTPTGTAKTCTADATTDTVTVPSGHPFKNGGSVRFTSTGTLPAPLVAGTTYYVSNATATTFKVSRSSGKNLLSRNMAGAEVDASEGPSYPDLTLVTRDTTQFWEGVASYKFNTTTVAGDGHPSHIFYMQGVPASAVPAETRVISSIYVKGVAGTAVVMSGRAADPNTFAYFADGGTVSYTLNGSWQRLETTPWSYGGATFMPALSVSVDGAVSTIMNLDGAMVEVKNADGATAWEEGIGTIDLTTAGTGTHSVVGVTGVAARYRSSNVTDINGLPVFSGSDNSDPAAITQNVEWAEVQLTLNGSGGITPYIGPGGISLFFTTLAPMLCREDRSPIPGGAVLKGIQRRYDLPEYVTDPVSGRARPISITDDVGRIDPFTVEFYNPIGHKIFMENQMEEDWCAEAPAQNKVHQLRLYENAEVGYQDLELLEETAGFWAAYATISRGEAIETDDLL